MQKPNKVAYSFLIGDLFHYGHLKMLEVARNNSDYHICGVISDSVVEKWISPKICTYIERAEVVGGCKFVDEVYSQDSMDPTDNLIKIHEKYPDAQIVLVQNHHLWESVLGSSYIAEIKGELLGHDFYPNLSRENISMAFFKSIIEKQDLNRVSFNALRIGDANNLQEHFSTKANTLQKLKHHLKHAIIEREFVFTVAQWDADKDGIIRVIEDLFTGKNVVIRSSSLNEDSLSYSNAGHYKSVLNVRTRAEDLRLAVGDVIGSYTNDAYSSNENQVLVQEQTEDVTLSGVVFTRNLLTNTPYYLVNYDGESGKTDSVTGGLAGRKVEILRDVDINTVSDTWRGLLRAVREVEAFFRGVALDIEFAIKTDGTIVIFQVRPLAANSKFHSLDDELINTSVEACRNTYTLVCNEDAVLSEELYLSDMAFWNPAELIGDRPSYLDYSLFNHLIMKSVWNEALVPLGYTKVNGDLQVLIGGKPYINIHNAFLCLLPDNTSRVLKTKLLNFYNKKLKKHPDLHDKIEFDIVHNCYRFDFVNAEKELLDNGFSTADVTTLKADLAQLTNDILSQFDSTLNRDNKSIQRLKDKYNAVKQSIKTDDWREKLRLIYQLTEDCMVLGTTPFARVARFAFIGTALLRSLQAAEIIGQKDYDAFMKSISTVATQMDRDFSLLRNGLMNSDAFLSQYGHLRPGTYDITKLPYSKNSAYLSADTNFASSKLQTPASGSLVDTALLADMSMRISEACISHNIRSDGNSLLEFIKKSIEMREYYKFEYTKYISLALELIAEVGNEMGFSREEMANLDYYSIVNYRESCSKYEFRNIWQNLIRSRKDERRTNQLLSLPAIIFSNMDFIVVPSYSATPNFITSVIIDGEVVCLDEGKADIDITNKIVVIEKADPGYDWIFTKKIKALITKYGGAASHMSIRCSEFGIPAAIGCGELLYSRIVRSSRIILDCDKKTINLV